MSAAPGPDRDVGTGWHDFRFVVQMPHLAPGEKLSEVEFLKLLAAYQWESIARMLGCRPSQIVNEQNERLYGSVIDMELCLGERHGMEILGEDATVHVRNRIRMFAKKFVEGFFVIDDREIPDAALGTVKHRDDLASLPYTWGCMTNAFIARGGDNLRLKVFKPKGADQRVIEELAEPPPGIALQGQVHRSGVMPAVPGEEDAILLEDRGREPIVYPIVAESDLNGAGLVYFARYEAMMNYGERIFLGSHLERPLSTELVSCLSPEHRKVCFFGNAAPTDRVEVRVSAGVLPRGRFVRGAVPPGYRTPMKFVFRIDLYRLSDNVLMASSVVRKALNVPGKAKNVLNEAERFLARLDA